MVIDEIAAAGVCASMACGGASRAAAATTTRSDRLRPSLFSTSRSPAAARPGDLGHAQGHRAPRPA